MVTSLPSGRTAAPDRWAPSETRVFVPSRTDLAPGMEEQACPRERQACPGLQGLMPPQGRRVPPVIVARPSKTVSIQFGCERTSVIRSQGCGSYFAESHSSSPRCDVFFVVGSWYSYVRCVPPTQSYNSKTQRSIPTLAQMAILHECWREHAHGQHIFSPASTANLPKNWRRASTPSVRSTGRRSPFLSEFEQSSIERYATQSRGARPQVD